MDGVTFRTHSGRLTPSETRDALAMLSAPERERLDGMSPARGDLFLAGRYVLRRLAAERLDVTADRVPLSARCPDCGGPHGQPVIVGSELRVSLSSCADGVVAVACWGRAIGVDVEPVEVAQERLDAIQSVAGGAGIAHWTRVEAVLKADGRGLRVDPREVIIEPVGDALRATLRDTRRRYDLSEPALDATLQIAVAVVSTTAP